MDCILLLASVLTPQPTGMIDIAQPLSPAELRAAYLTVASRSSKNAKPDNIVPELIAVYWEINRVKGISFRERKRMRTTLKSRLEKIQDRLRRERPTSRSVRAKALSGTEQQNADALIELIQNTIEPDSWRDNGGKGTIMYFSLLRALVVRQTGEGHHQLGGLLNQLK